MRHVMVLAIGVALLVGFVAASAASAETFEVSTKEKTGTFMLTGGVTRLLDGSTELNCEEAEIAGTINEGREVSGEALGEVTSGSWNHGEETCEGPLGIAFGIVPLFPWKILKAVRLNGGDLVDYEWEVFALHIKGLWCNFLVRGVIKLLWHNIAQQLLVTGANLAVENVSGCFGLIKNGDKPTFDATFAALAGEEIQIR